MSLFKKLPNNIENQDKYTFTIWDKFAKEFITKYPEMKKYFIHINSFRCAYLN